jgi:hypothetical protein
MEIHAVQILGPQDYQLDSSSGGQTVVDSETGAMQGIALGSDSLSLYQQLLRDHIAAVRQHCLSHQIAFLTATLGEGESLEQTALATVSSMGLFV